MESGDRLPDHDQHESGNRDQTCDAEQSCDYGSDYDGNHRSPDHPLQEEPLAPFASHMASRVQFYEYFALLNTFCQRKSPSLADWRP